MHAHATIHSEPQGALAGCRLVVHKLHTYFPRTSTQSRATLGANVLHDAQHLYDCKLTFILSGHNDNGFLTAVHGRSSVTHASRAATLGTVPAAVPYRPVPSRTSTRARQSGGGGGRTGRTVQP
eukprot:366522-Chlamydomonas_euryale.AAC.7